MKAVEMEVVTMEVIVTHLQIIKVVGVQALWLKP
jgi:hypothetical protein